MPTNGKVLSKRTAKLFPHLKFAEQASDQLDKIKDSAVVQQIYWRLSDLERVAANSTSPVSPEKFKYKTTPESETRSRLPQLKILFSDGETGSAPGIHALHPVRDEYIFVQMNLNRSFI